MNPQSDFPARIRGHTMKQTHRATWQPKFEQFHRDNPEIYRMLVRDAHKVQSKGKRCSIYLLIERVRWFMTIETEGKQAEEFRINNNFSPFYARKLMAEEPGFKDFFQIRDQEQPECVYHHPHVDLAIIELPDEEGL